MATANLKKSEDFVTNTTAASKFIHRRPGISIDWNPTFQTSLHKKRLKGGISIYADFGPLRYVLWCCGGICHEVLTFFQIGCGHTVAVSMPVLSFLSSLTQLRTFTSCKVPNSTSCRRLRESDQIVPLVGFENQNLSNLKVCFTLFKKWKLKKEEERKSERSERLNRED